MSDQADLQGLPPDSSPTTGIVSSPAPESTAPDVPVQPEAGETGKPAKAPKAPKASAPAPTDFVAVKYLGVIEGAGREMFGITKTPVYFDGATGIASDIEPENLEHFLSHPSFAGVTAAELAGK